MRPPIGSLAMRCSRLLGAVILLASGGMSLLQAAPGGSSGDRSSETQLRKALQEERIAAGEELRAAMKQAKGEERGALLAEFLLREEKRRNELNWLQSAAGFRASPIRGIDSAVGSKDEFQKRRVKLANDLVNSLNGSGSAEKEGEAFLKWQERNARELEELQGAVLQRAENWSSGKASKSLKTKEDSRPRSERHALRARIADSLAALMEARQRMSPAEWNEAFLKWQEEHEKHRLQLIKELETLPDD